MNRDAILELFNKHLRKDLIYPDCRRESTETVIRLVSLTNEPGMICFSKLNEVNADAAIDDQLTYFQGLKQTFEWKVFDYDQPSNLKERLKSKGFSIEEPEALMIADLTETNPLLAISVHSEVRRITDEQGIWDIIKLEEEVWGESHQDLGERFVRELNDPSAHLSIYAAYVDGKAVSAAWMYLHEGTPFASLWGGSTHPEFRKKGYYSSLLGIRAGEAAAKGYQLLMVDASPMSRPILEKQGFQCLAFSTPCMSPNFE